MPVVADRLSKRFGDKVAVDALSFEIREGEVFGLLGPNGAGKTTTIRMLASLIKPTSGSAMVEDFDVVEQPVDVRQTVGILTENPSLYERLSAVENLQFFGEAYGVPPGRREARIRELLEFFDLWDRRNDKTGTYSKGMKQKLAIARALVHDPKILFLDEPTSGLDPASAKEIRDLIVKLGKEHRIILLSTHHLEDAEKLCSRVMLINKGRAVATGTLEELQSMVSTSSKVVVTMREAKPGVAIAVRNMDNIESLEESGPHITITLKDPTAMTPGIVREIVANGGEVLSVAIVRPSLEEAYLKLIGD